MEPSAPASSTFMYMSPTYVFLSWAPPENDGGSPITTYLLSLTPDNQPTSEHEIAAPTLTYPLTGLVHGISVQATVKASNDGGVTYGPECIFPLIIPILPPSSPPATAEAVVIGPGSVTVSWTPPEIAPEGYGYYIVTSQSSNPDDPSNGYSTIDMTELSCVFNQLNQSSEYSFKVKIINQLGTSPATVTNTVIPQ